MFEKLNLYFFGETEIAFEDGLIFYGATGGMLFVGFLNLLFG